MPGSGARFLGFALGAQVSLGVSQPGGASASVAVPSWGAGMSGAVSVSVERTADRVAPDPVIFEAEATGFVLPNAPAGSTSWQPDFHGLLIKWTFPDEGKSAYLAPENMLDAWNDPRVKYGKRVAHVFETPGSKTVTVEVWDRNGTYATQQVVLAGAESVIDPETAYPATQTILCDPTLAGDAAYPSAALEPTLEAAIARLRGLSGAQRGRVLFRRGETFVHASRIDIDTLFGNADLGAFGTGADPVIRFGGTETFNWLLRQDLPGTPVVRLVGLDIQSVWDATTEGPIPDGYFRIQANYPVLFHECRFAGHNLVSLAGRAGCRLFFSDTVVTNWRDYGALLGAEAGASDVEVFVLGGRWAQTPDAQSGGPKFTDPAFNNHGPLRVSGLETLYITGTDFFSANGWFPNSDYLTIQSCLRVTELPEGAKVHLTGNTFEGSVSLAPTNGSADNAALNAIVEDFLIVSGANTSFDSLALQKPGTTVRNGTLLRAQVDSHHDLGFGAPIKVKADGTYLGAALNEPIEIYNVTAVDLTTSGQSSVTTAIDLSEAGPFAAVTTDNNITHFPNRAAPVIPQAPLTAGPIRYAPRFEGFRYTTGALGSMPLGLAIDATQTTGLQTSESFGTPYARRLAEEAQPTLLIGSEEISFTGVTNVGGTTWELTGVQRGVNGTTATSHASGEMVTNGPVPLLTRFASPADLVRLYEPASGSSALGQGASGLSWMQDMLRNPRPAGAEDAGAVQSG